MKPLGKNLLVMGCLLVVVGCKKTQEIALPQNPSNPIADMVYANYGNKQITPHPQTNTFLDIDKNGTIDVGLSTTLVGDPINVVDKLKFDVLSNFYTSMPINVNDEIFPLNYGDSIPIKDFNNSEWYNGCRITLFERHEYSNPPMKWFGNWLNAINKYVPFQILKNNKRYNGWLQISEDKSNNAIILHKSAYCTTPEKGIKAGL